MSGPFGSSQWMYKTGGFYPHELDQSLKFNDDDNHYLQKTISTTQTNTKKITISVWVKRGNLGKTRDTIIFARNGGAGRLGFDSDKIFGNAFDTCYNGFLSVGVFRDVSAWYHIVYQGNSDTSTLADINKVYVSVEHMKEQIISHLEEIKSRYSVNISYIIEDQPMGTGGSIYRVFDENEDCENLIIVMADVVF